jgi:putative protein kinase ArgK-like GTPase of G3E family
MLDRKPDVQAGWRPPICLTSASLNRGVPGLCDALRRHHDHLAATQGLAERRRRRLESELRRKIDAELTRVFWGELVAPAEVTRWVDALEQREIDPQRLARSVVGERVEAGAQRRNRRA